MLRRAASWHVVAFRQLGPDCEMVHRRFLEMMRPPFYSACDAINSFSLSLLWDCVGVGALFCICAKGSGDFIGGQLFRWGGRGEMSKKGVFGGWSSDEERGASKGVAVFREEGCGRMERSLDSSVLSLLPGWGNFFNNFWCVSTCLTMLWKQIFV